MQGGGRYIGVFVFGLLLGAAAYGLYLSVVHPPKAEAQTLSAAERAKLQAEYDQLQQEIAQWQKVLDDTKAKKNTLSGDVTALTAKINEATAQIKAKNVAIQQLADQISQKNAQIQTLQAQIDAGMESLRKLIRLQNESDNYSLVAVVLSADNLSSFFNDVQARDVLQERLQEKFNEIRQVKTKTEIEKKDLSQKKDSQEDARHAVETAKAKVAADKTEKNRLLAITKQEEAEYQKVLADRQAKAAAIKAALFPLRDASAISFGTALQYAQMAQRSTGVEPALILAILTQESNLGSNVGQCYLANNSTGAGIGKNSGAVFSKVMHPTRDVPPFLALAERLGFDPHRQVVSCPIASAGGYGGAMGPAQFIASTWALYADRIATAEGKAVANPWDPRDAITAMGFLLADNGASAGGYTAQFKAAARYYAGWNGPNTAAGRGYANQVMAKVAQIQKDIDFLNDL